LPPAREAKLIANYGSLEQVPPDVWQEMTSRQGTKKDEFRLAA
jgi:hypothetical protein